jgi:hypothetical protein
MFVLQVTQQVSLLRPLQKSKSCPKFLSVEDVALDLQWIPQLRKEFDLIYGAAYRDLGMRSATPGALLLRCFVCVLTVF